MITTMKFSLVTATIFAAGLAPAISAGAPPQKTEQRQQQQSSAAEQQYYQAFYKETALRDFEAALAAYGEAVAAAKKEGKTELSVKGLLGRARCLKAMGRADESAAAFRAA